MKTLHHGKIDIYAPKRYFMSNNSCQACYCTKIDVFSCICINSFLKSTFLMFAYRFVHTMIIKYFTHIAAGLLTTARGKLICGTPFKIDIHVLIYNCKVWCFSVLCHDLLNFLA